MDIIREINVQDPNLILSYKSTASLT